MKNDNINLNSLSENEVKNIETLVYMRFGEYRKSVLIMREDVFKILEMNARVIYYPIEDDDFCAFVVKYKGKNFAFINTNIQLEKQIFAAAHELYHIWYSDISNGILVSRYELEELESRTLSKEECKAKRFAAEFLSPKGALINELDIRNIKKDNIELNHIVKLMDVFILPYKTMVRRLFEVGYISEAECMEFLKIEDGDPTNGVMFMQKRLKICYRNNERTCQIKFDRIQDLSLSLYENGLITKERLAYYLNLEGSSLKDFNIEEDSLYLPSEEEVLLAMED